MPTRIDIELTSASGDGSWTWRAAGAREPKGTLDGSILPAGAAVGDQLRAETEKDVDGIRILSIVPPKPKGATRSDVLELLPSSDFEPVTQQRASRDRHERRPRAPAPRADDRGDRGDRERPEATAVTARSRPTSAIGLVAGERRGDRRDGDGVRRRRSSDGERQRPTDRISRRRPSCRSARSRSACGRASNISARCSPSLPEEQRPVAELALQGMAAVRQRLREDNARLKAAGKPEMPEATVLKMAEDLLPQLRVADWLDRAEAAKRQLAHLDLRDLRSVVAASDDPLSSATSRRARSPPS